MKKKFILIDDDQNRQKRFLDNNNIKLPENDEFFNNITDKNIIDDLNNRFKKREFDQNIIKDYDILAVHETFIKSIKEYLKTYCVEKQKDLILFSGGISRTFDQQLGESTAILITINDKKFYSKNLIDFLKSEDRNVMLLAYGEKWRIEQRMILAEKLSYVLSLSNNKFKLKEFNINAWQKNTYFNNYEMTSELDKNEILDILKKINKDINAIL
ncbi:MAG: hypothetical protein KatS3mg027_2342 [Bacteroidia bacterium]|nr:MAG: hypothetical protein KatS3mg027_2342 [Bacteroidia bacterium]